MYQVICDDYSKYQVGSLHEPTHSADVPKHHKKRGAEDAVAQNSKRSKAKEEVEEPAKEKTEGEAVEAVAPPATGPIKAPPEMSFCLRWDEENDIEGTKFYTLEKPYLRTSSAISILHLKKYLAQKFNLQTSTKPVRFRCRGQLLDDKLRVAEVYETIWKDANQDLDLHFCTTSLTG